MPYGRIYRNVEGRESSRKEGEGVIKRRERKSSRVEGRESSKSGGEGVIKRRGEGGHREWRG